MIWCHHHTYCSDRLPGRGCAWLSDSPKWRPANRGIPVSRYTHPLGTPVTRADSFNPSPPHPCPRVCMRGCVHVCVVSYFLFFATIFRSARRYPRITHDDGRSIHRARHCRWPRSPYICLYVNRMLPCMLAAVRVDAFSGRLNRTCELR